MMKPISIMVSAAPIRKSSPAVWKWPMFRREAIVLKLFLRKTAETNVKTQTTTSPTMIPAIKPISPGPLKSLGTKPPLPKGIMPDPPMKDRTLAAPTTMPATMPTMLSTIAMSALLNIDLSTRLSERYLTATSTRMNPTMLMTGMKVPIRSSMDPIPPKDLA